MSLAISQRLQSLPPSSTIGMHQRAMALKASGKDIINLSIGEPDFATPLPIQQAAKEAIDTGQYFSYSPIAGYADLRAAIAYKLRQENGLAYTKEQIVVSTGAKQALTNLFFALFDPGDEVILFSPYWSSYHSMIKLAGGTPVPLQGDLTKGFEPTAAQLSQALTPRTKAILFSNPCNPTGHVFAKQSMCEWAEVLKGHPQVLIISDEIYEHIYFAEAPTSIGALEALAPRVVTVNGFSKGFAMTGWRVGYLAAPLWLAQACEKLQGQMTSGTCSIAQRAALAAIQGNCMAIKQMRDAYHERRDLVLLQLQSIPGISCYKPKGAFYLFPDVSAYFGTSYQKWHIATAQDLCLYLLEEAQVSLVAGASFGEPRCVRLSYATSKSLLQTALVRMQRALAKLQ